jgi:hypothetical protein
VSSFAAIGGAELRRIVGPGPAANHPAIAIAHRLRVTVAGVPAVDFVPTILGPLPNVTVDVVKAPWVGLKAVDRHTVRCRYSPLAPPPW